LSFPFAILNELIHYYIYQANYIYIDSHPLSYIKAMTLPV